MTCWQSVEKARQAWIKKLIDQCRRKNLLYYRSLKWGTLSLSLENGDRYGDVLRLDCWLHNSCTIAPEQWLFAKQ